MLCIQCSLAEIPRGSTKYCSRTCMALGYRKQKPACIVCGNEAYSINSKFCSRRCSGTFYGRITAKFNTCLFCSGLHKNKFYCSYKCSARDQGNKKISLLSEEERKEKDRVYNLAAVRRYQARRYSQTPADADQHQIREIYAHCPEGYEVDHVIPISKGGLHHQLNLQYLPKLDNRRKSNKIRVISSAEEHGPLNPGVGCSTHP